MGYDYELQGWCETKRPIDLEAFKTSHPDSLEFVTFHVTGHRKNVLLFAGSGKSVHHYYLTPIPLIMDAFGGGRGIVTITGEISHDGKDATLLVHDGKLLAVPLRQLYDTDSPWHALYEACHYMGGHGQYAVLPDAMDLSSLADCSKIRGWLRLRTRLEAAAVHELCSALESRCPDLRGGIVGLDFYDPILLFGQDEVDAIAAVSAIAEMTSAFPYAFGVLYGAGSDERHKVPVRIERGHAILLDAVSIDPAGQKLEYPVTLPANAGMGDGLSYIDLKGPSDLDALMEALAPLISDSSSATPPQCDSSIGWARYVFEACGLVCEIRSNDPATTRSTEGFWPFGLWAYLDSGFDPRMLADCTLQLAKLLPGIGIEFRPTKVYLSFRSYIAIPSGELVDRE